MFGYGALLNSELVSNLGRVWDSFIHTIMDAPFYWYIAAFIGLAVCYKLLTRE